MIHIDSSKKPAKVTRYVVYYCPSEKNGILLWREPRSRTSLQIHNITNETLPDVLKAAKEMLEFGHEVTIHLMP